MLGTSGECIPRDQVVQSHARHRASRDRAQVLEEQPSMARLYREGNARNLRREDAQRKTPLREQRGFWV
jgi:hypothetical protein